MPNQQQSQSHIVIPIFTVKVLDYPVHFQAERLYPFADVNLIILSLSRTRHTSCTRETFLFSQTTSLIATHNLLFGLH